MSSHILVTALSDYGLVGLVCPRALQILVRRQLQKLTHFDNQGIGGLQGSAYRGERYSDD